MVAVGQTITIVNKSGKIVSTSKHLVNVFKEAKSAYGERKAEIKALRRNEQEIKDWKARRQLDALTLDDYDDDRSSRASSRRSSRRGSEDGRRAERRPVTDRSTKRGSDDGAGVRRKPVASPRAERPPVERGVSDSFYTNDARPPRPSPLRFDSNGGVCDDAPRAGELIRRRTDGWDHDSHGRRAPKRSASQDDIDMDLAYGELPPPLPERKYDTEVELRSKMSGLQQLLDEFNCVQHSVSAIVEKLQKNPDALAAVALTLAEISNLVTKLAPGALTGLKSAFPAILALLAQPEFAIALGVGVGVTVVAFGGYKIVKKIKAKREAHLLEDGTREPAEPESPPGEPEELQEIDRIELWRRGIADVEADSLCTSVEGEFVTPRASRTLIEEGRLTEANLKTSTGEKKHQKTKTKQGKSERGSKSASASKAKAKKQTGGLRMLFKASA